MNKNKYALLRTLAIALAFLCVLSACDTGYKAEDVVNADAPIIITQPQSIGADVGEDAALTVVATPPEPLKTANLITMWSLPMNIQALQAGK